MDSLSLAGLDVLEEVSQRHVGHPKRSGGAPESILDFARFEMLGERGEIPLEVLDVGVESDGGIIDDFVLIEASRASLGTRVSVIPALNTISWPRASLSSPHWMGAVNAVGEYTKYRSVLR